MVRLTTLSEGQYVINWYECERKRSWPNLMTCPKTYLELLSSATKNLIQDSRSPGRHLNPGPRNYEAGDLSIQKDSR
jgi:hypothetical protein